MSTTVTKFVPQPRKGPSEDDGILATILRYITNVGMIIYFILEAFVLKFVPSKYRMKSVKDEIILVTGAGSGIGRLMAIKFAALGAKVVCWDINKDGIEETVNEIKNQGGSAFSYVCNVADRATVYAVAEKVRQEVGKVSIIINNAGIVTGKRLMEIPDEGIERTYKVNILAHYWIVKAFLPEMQASNHGHIVSISSLAGQAGVNRLTDYCGSKFAAVGFNEALACELYHEGYTGIKITTVCPYFINTGMFHGTNFGPFGYQNPDDVASAIVKGVLLNEGLIVLPGLLLISLLFKHWVPARVAPFMSTELGFNDAMNGFDPASRQKKAE